MLDYRSHYAFIVLALSFLSAATVLMVDCEKSKFVASEAATSTFRWRPAVVPDYDFSPLLIERPLAFTMSLPLLLKISMIPVSLLSSTFFYLHVFIPLFGTS
jgi:hypothetical protein